jgi:uncharacterized protein (DUF4415 family)
MSAENTKKVRPSTEEQLAALAALPDDQIDLSDIPELTEEFWANAVRGKFYRPVKKQISVRIDADIIDWLKRTGAEKGQGYQTRMNQILREAMLEDLNKAT